MEKSFFKNNEKTVIRFLLVISILVFAVYSERVIGRGFKLSAIFLLLCFILFLVGFLGLKSILFKEDQIHVTYLKIALPLLIFYSFLLPPGMVPDENTHLKNVASLSSQLLGVEINHKATLTYDEYRMIYDNNWDDASKLNVREVRKYVLANIRNKANKSLVALDKASTVTSSMFYYFPAVLGLTFGRIFGFNAIISFFFARFFGMFVFLAICYYALKKMPIKKNLFFGILLLPVVLQQGMSISYDLMLNACSFLSISLGLNFAINQSKKNIKDIILFLFAALVLLFVKSGLYAFVLLISVIGVLSSSRKKLNVRQILYFVGTVLLLLAIRLFVTHFDRSFDTINNVLYAKLPWNSSKSQFMYTTGYFIAHPFRLPYIILNDIRIHFGFYFRTAFSTMGWLNIQLSTALNFVWVFIFMIASYFDQNSNFKFNKLQKIFISLLMIVEAVLVLMGLILLWTPLGENHIYGVQGRYFIPLLLPVFIILESKIKCSNQFNVKYINIAFLSLTVIEALDLLYLAL